jgi:NADP-dependent 3-hydroxy acid dehydrogenase YdfG
LDDDLFENTTEEILELPDLEQAATSVEESIIEENTEVSAQTEIKMTNENTPPTLDVNTAMLQKLQEDIKRLENLLLSNQSLLQSTQQHLEEIPTSDEQEVENEDEFPMLGAEKEPVKTVLITGATSGIGKATADIFAANGYRLILTGRRTDRLAIIKQQYEDTYGSEVLIQDFDVRDPLSVEEMMEKLDKNWQNIDLLINNAGLAKGFEPIHEGKLEDWEAMIDTNIKGLLYMTRMIAPLMVARGGGQIINICSIAGKEVYPNGAVYCATKHAVDALTKGMRLDLHKYNIRVSQVAPAHVEETEFSLVRYDGDEEKSANVYKDFQPLKAIDVAETIYFIASRPNHVNIQDVVLYGTQQASATIVNRSGREKETLPEEETSTRVFTIAEEKLELTNI